MMYILLYALYKISFNFYKNIICSHKNRFPIKQLFLFLNKEFSCSSLIMGCTWTASPFPPKLFKMSLLHCLYYGSNLCKRLLARLQQKDYTELLQLTAQVLEFQDGAQGYKYEYTYIHVHGCGAVMKKKKIKGMAH